MNIIKNHPKITSLDDIHRLARMFGHKESTAERSMRLLCAGDVEPVKNEKGHITGYRWIKKLN